nr:hypothetical protein [Gammaproteobacteria bacterium]
ARSSKHRGFGWKRWSKPWLYEALGLFHRLCSALVLTPYFEAIFFKRLRDQARQYKFLITQDHQHED